LNLKIRSRIAQGQPLDRQKEAFLRKLEEIVVKKNQEKNCSQRQTDLSSTFLLKFAVLLEKGLKKVLKGCIIAISGYCNSGAS